MHLLTRHLPELGQHPADLAFLEFFGTHCWHGETSSSDPTDAFESIFNDFGI
jgi:hypothetical protein